MFIQHIKENIQRFTPNKCVSISRFIEMFFTPLVHARTADHSFFLQTMVRTTALWVQAILFFLLKGHLEMSTSSCTRGHL